MALQRRDRLTVCTGTVVTRLELDGRKGLVTGAHIRSAKATDNSSSGDVFVKARREVIICSGAICTPQLLMLSGIGPRDSAQHLKTPLVKELPAVGAKLSDHFSFPIMMELPRKDTLHILEGIWALWHMLLWLLFGLGLMSTGSTLHSIFARTAAINEKTMQVEPEDDDGNDTLDASKPHNIPNLEIMVIPVSCFQRPVPGYTLLTLYTTLIQPSGHGQVELASSDPLAHPRVTLPMFRDSQDFVTARRGARFAMRMAEEFNKSGYPYPAPLVFAPGNNIDLLTKWEESGEAGMDSPPGSGTQKSLEEKATEGVQTKKGKTWRDVTDDEIDDYVARVSHTSLHYAGTCGMSNDEKTGVVDQQLRVHGFKNLRVADASIFPRTPSAHPMAAIMMISQRCAEFIQNDWAKRKTD